ncbi:hypothetical protein DSO57_1017904 [Entomophthora muscae]|uniref:Uncharacterized protein n=1 Tax=Entomophthora muscae TaxID=34485 RepID=A0ACC2RJ35_9FUNG|nr:hypothetical protein DSO57_1017904 [Entomophthora muscae]
MLVASDPTVQVLFCGTATHSIHIFVFVSSVLPRLSLATPSRDYPSRAARLGFPVVCLCHASEHDISQEHPNTAWTEHLPTALLILQARINRGTGFSPSTLAFGKPDSLTGVEQGKLQSNVPDKPPLVTTPSLDQWCAKAWEIKHKQIAGGTKHLEARYAVGDPIYTLNPNSTKLEPNHLGLFKVVAVYNNQIYQLEDAQGNTKKLYHNCLRPCCAIPTQRLFVRTFLHILQTPVLVSDNKQGARGVLQPSFQTCPLTYLTIHRGRSKSCPLTCLMSWINLMAISNGRHFILIRSVANLTC